MTNRKVNITLLMVLMGLYAAAQDLNIFIGAQATALDASPSSRDGLFYGGAYTNIKVYKNFYFQPGISYSPKNAYYLLGVPSFSMLSTDQIKTSFVDIPLLIALRAPGNSRVRFMAAVGPLVSIGFRGKRSYSTHDGGEITENPFKSGYLRRFDLGGYAKIGIELGRFTIYSSSSIGVFKGRAFQSIASSVSFRLLDFSKKKHAAQER